jgi:hypothetical protein
MSRAAIVATIVIGTLAFSLPSVAASDEELGRLGAPDVRAPFFYRAWPFAPFVCPLRWRCALRRALALATPAWPLAARFRMPKPRCLPHRPAFSV